MGNELWGSPAAVNELVGRYKSYDSRHLYTQGSNNFQWIPNIQSNDDFFCGVRFTVDRQIRGSYAMCDQPLGHVQTGRPCTDFNYESAIFPIIRRTAPKSVRTAPLKSNMVRGSSASNSPRLQKN